MGMLPVLMSSQEKAKIKQSLLLTWTGPEGSRKLRLPDFMTIIA
jgi:hypothetical protein